MIRINTESANLMQVVDALVTHNPLTVRTIGRELATEDQTWTYSGWSDTF